MWIGFILLLIDKALQKVLPVPNIIINEHKPNYSTLNMTEAH